MGYQNHTQAAAAWKADRAGFAMRGLNVPGVVRYLPDEWRGNYALAMDQAGVASAMARNGYGYGMDAQPALTTDPTAGIPVILTTTIDPDVTRILFTPNEAAEIMGEKKAGDWLDSTRLFPVVEHTGEVTSYGDFATSGRAGVNADWPTFQSYLFQIIKEYGEKELALAGLAKLNWVSEYDQAATTILEKFRNYTYFFGVQGLNNYGLLNNPLLTASLTPALKAYGGTKWIQAGFGQASPNEIFTDIQAVFFQLVNQTNGAVNRKTKLILALSPISDAALTATNSFNVDVANLLEKNFPNIEVKTAIQYGQTSSSNNQGINAGNLMQLIAPRVDGQETGYTAFNEKLRSHPIIRDLSSFKQKVTAGTWGTILKQPFAIASMLGI